MDEALIIILGNICVFAFGLLIGWFVRDSGKFHNVKQWDEGQRIGYRRGYLQGFYDASHKPDCEHAEHDGVGCLGYCACIQDDQPIEICDRCEKYTGNITGR